MRFPPLHCALPRTTAANSEGSKAVNFGLVPALSNKAGPVHTIMMTRVSRVICAVRTVVALSKVWLGAHRPHLQGGRHEAPRLSTAIPHIATNTVADPILNSEILAIIRNPHKYCSTHERTIATDSDRSWQCQCMRGLAEV